MVRGERAAQVALRPLGQALEVGGSEAAQHDHLRAAQEGCVQLEARVLGRGADEDDGAVFHVGQEAVLLGLVEAVDLVHEEERALAVGAADAGLLEHAAQVGHAGEDRGDLDEGHVGLVRKQSRDGGLADARRAPEDQRGQAAGGEHRAQRAVGGEDRGLAHDVGEPARPQPIGERATAMRRGGSGFRSKRSDMSA